MGRTCIGCKQTKSIEMFMAHKASKGGRLVRCRECVNSARRHSDAMRAKEDPSFLESKRRESRMRYHTRQKKIETFPVDENFRRILMTTEEKKSRKKQGHDVYYKEFPEKWNAKNRCQRLKTKIHGNQYHHWSYNAEHYRDVIELTVFEHTNVHRFIVYDRERFMYRRYDTNELLDTREAHEAFIQHVLTNLV
jgi:hypothetical protein